MKGVKWLVTTLVGICLSAVLLAGCGIPKSEHEALQANYDTLKSEHEALQSRYEAVVEELDAIKEVYPPKDFSSRSELQDWLLKNNVSERQAATTAEGLYSKALEIQADALKDGYIVSANLMYDEPTGYYYISCITIINGDIWAWDPETDEPVQYFYLGKVK